MSSVRACTWARRQSLVLLSATYPEHLHVLTAASHFRNNVQSSDPTSVIFIEGRSMSGVAFGSIDWKWEIKEITISLKQLARKMSLQKSRFYVQRSTVAHRLHNVNKADAIIDGMAI